MLRLPFGITITRQDDSLVFTRGDRQLVVHCGPAWYCRRDMSLGFTLDRTLCPDDEAFRDADFSMGISWSWRLIRLRWYADAFDVCTTWTGREWRLHSWYVDAGYYVYRGRHAPA